MASTSISDDGSGNMVAKKSKKSIENSDKNIISLKNNLNVKMRSIGSLVDPRTELSTPCNDDVDTWWAKRFILQTIHTGVNKAVRHV